jgi:hypothetical protein
MNTIFVGETEYTILCAYDNGSCELLFGANYDGTADFKYLCCFAVPHGDAWCCANAMAGDDYFDILSVFKQRVVTELSGLLDLLVRDEEDDDA